MALSAASITFTYPVTDTVNDSAVAESLLQELVDAGPYSTLGIESVDLVAGNIKVVASVTPGSLDLAADEAIVAAAVVAHEGEPIGANFQKQQNDADQGIGIGDNQQVVALQSTPLKAGEYAVTYTIEVESTDPTTDVTMRAELFGTTKASERMTGELKRMFTTGISSTRTAGQKVIARIEADVAAGAVTVRNRRISMVRIDE